MKKIILTTVAIVLSLSFSTLSAQSRRHHNDRRSHRIEQGSVEYLNSIPSVSVGVDFGGVHLWYNSGVYYREHDRSRYEVVRPPRGMMVHKIYKAKSFRDRGEKFYVSNGVVYRKVKTPRGKMYEVVSYRDHYSFRR